MKWYGMELNGIEWNEMEWNGMKESKKEILLARRNVFISRGIPFNRLSRDIIWYTSIIQILVQQK